MSDRLGSASQLQRRVRLNPAVMILSVLLMIGCTGWAVIELSRNAGSAICPPQILHQMLAERVQLPVAKEPLAVAPAPRAKRPGPAALPDGMVMVPIPVNSSQGSGFVAIVPGSRVDVLVIGRYDGKLRAFPMLLDCQVLAVDAQVSQLQTLPGTDTVMLAVNTEEARLVSLAKSRGCHFDILLRHPNVNVGCDVDMRMIERVLNRLSPVESREEALPMAPAPHLKGR